MKHGGSNLRGFATSVRLTRTLSEVVEFPCTSIHLELTIPRLGIELGKPLTKGRQLVGRKALNLTLEIANFTHRIAPRCRWNYTLRPLDRAANREKALLSNVFSYAIRWGVAKDNPCRHVKRNPEVRRERLPEPQELTAFKASRLLAPMGRRVMPPRWPRSCENASHPHDAEFDSGLPAPTTLREATACRPMSTRLRSKSRPIDARRSLGTGCDCSCPPSTAA